MNWDFREEVRAMAPTGREGGGERRGSARRRKEKRERRRESLDEPQAGER